MFCIVIIFQFSLKILITFVTENNITDYQVARVQEQDLSPVSSSLEQLSLYDKFIEVCIQFSPTYRALCVLAKCLLRFEYTCHITWVSHRYTFTCLLVISNELFFVRRIIYEDWRRKRLVASFLFHFALHSFLN